MKDFTRNYKEQLNSIDLREFHEEFYTMSCFNCDCPNHSHCSMSCGLKNVQISEDGKCVYWNEMNNKKTKLMYKGMEIDEEVAEYIMANPFLDKEFIEKYLDLLYSETDNNTIADSSIKYIPEKEHSISNFTEVFGKALKMKEKYTVKHPVNYSLYI